MECDLHRSLLLPPPWPKNLLQNLLASRPNLLLYRSAAESSDSSSSFSSSSDGSSESETFDSNNKNQKPRAKPTSKSSKPTRYKHSSTRSTHTTPKTQSTVSSEAIFFGASFAFDGKIQPKSTPVKNGMQEVVVILHTLLSSDTEFYSENVDNFEDDPEAERVIHLLESWDRKIFGHPQGRQDSAIVKEAPVSRNGSKTPPSTTLIVTQHEKHGKINI
ncbi:hypothetical protein BDP27DRAFT_1424656 [Rhodocollybia butyracea]|uniref:Uncharacterized protein n=1 Tax=Rhodocollybia butyracea TaxID=206335 RepID=A0A9P5U4F8_9AGAR|nr:hypothetical protein BDP27DRAFT_1424656 [Rhodocollybia butyracea]